jgi:hypothetical protein
MGQTFVAIIACSLGQANIPQKLNRPRAVQRNQTQVERAHDDFESCEVFWFADEVVRSKMGEAYANTLEGTKEGGSMSCAGFYRVRAAVTWCHYWDELPAGFVFRTPN